MTLITHVSALISVLATTVISQLHLRQQDVEPSDVLLCLSVGDMLNFMAQVTIVHRTGLARKATNHKSLRSKPNRFTYHIMFIEQNYCAKLLHMWFQVNT